MNSLLATLNARPSLRQTLTTTDLVSIPLSKATVVSQPGPPRRPSRGTSNTTTTKSDNNKDTVVNIRVETTTDRRYDGESVRFEPESPVSLRYERDRDSVSYVPDTPTSEPRVRRASDACCALIKEDSSPRTESSDVCIR